MFFVFLFEKKILVALMATLKFLVALSWKIFGFVTCQDDKASIFFDLRPIWFHLQLFLADFQKENLNPCQSPFDMYCGPQHIFGRKLFFSSLSRILVALAAKRVQVKKRSLFILESCVIAGIGLVTK